MTESVNSFFWHLYTVWAVLAMVVGWQWIRSSIQSWHDVNGTWTGMFRQWFAVPSYIVKMCAKDIKDIVRRRKFQPESASDMPYTPGHLLRFFTALSFLAIMCFGYMFRSLDRSSWDPVFMAINASVVSVSILAILGNLYIRWMDSLRIWRWTVVASVLWIGVMPFTGVWR